jgi:hypothetical protein
MDTYPDSVDDFNDLLDAFSWVQEQGPVKAISGGPHSVGTTLELLLNHQLDADSASDFGFTEIKAQRSGTSSPTTLFTKEPTYNEGWSMRRVLEVHGYEDDNGRTALKINLATHERHGLSLNSEGGYLNLYSDELGEEIGYWTAETVSTGVEKISDICYIYADEDYDDDGDETFHYQSFQRLTLPPNFDADNLIDLIDDGSVRVELRTHINLDNTVRNYGTAFRAPNILNIDLYDIENLI